MSRWLARLFIPPLVAYGAVLATFPALVVVGMAVGGPYVGVYVAGALLENFLAGAAWGAVILLAIHLVLVLPLFLLLSRRRQPPRWLMAILAGIIGLFAADAISMRPRATLPRGLGDAARWAIVYGVAGGVLGWTLAGARLRRDTDRAAEPRS